MAKRKFKAMKESALGRFFPCVLVSIALVLLSTLVMAALAAISENPTGKIGIYSLVALILSAILSGIISARISGAEGIKYPLLSALCVVLIMLLFSVVIEGAPSASSLMNYGTFVAVSAFSGFLGRKREKRRARR